MRMAMRSEEEMVDVVDAVVGVAAVVVGAVVEVVVGKSNSAMVISDLYKSNGVIQSEKILKGKGW